MAKKASKPTVGAPAPDAADELDRVFAAVARYFGVLSEPTRLKILHAICRDERSVSSIVGMLFGSIAGLRILLLAAVEARLGRSPAAIAPTPWFLIFGEFVYFAVWLWAFTGRTVVWRGQRLRILPGGRIVAEDAPPALLPNAHEEAAT